MMYINSVPGNRYGARSTTPRVYIYDHIYTDSYKKLYRTEMVTIFSVPGLSVLTGFGCMFETT